MMVVIAAGNEGQIGITLDQRTPQVLGTADNDIITVGAINNNGSLIPSSTPEKPGIGGSLTLYAQGTDVVCASNTLLSENDSQMREGSSFAAAQIVSFLPTLSKDFNPNIQQAGLAAYFYSTQSNLNSTADLKKFLVDKSYQRVGDDKIISFPENALAYKDFMPEKVITPWNLATA
jgi:hypothetical protein